jgi:hypothetical protein
LPRYPTVIMCRRCSKSYMPFMLPLFDVPLKEYPLPKWGEVFAAEKRRNEAAAGNQPAAEGADSNLI